MYNLESPNHGVLRDESERSVRVLSRPPPEPPIEISDTEMSTYFSDNQYGF
ncbi:hypothetical protein MKX03_018531, partial [Papaver bracteatum]